MKELFCYPVSGRVGPLNLKTEFRIDTFFAASGSGYAFIKDRQGRFVVHTGLDINKGLGNQDRGLPVFATRPGVVEFVAFDPKGFGNVVGMRHDGDAALTVYGE
ncbi:MAG: hypothetical protein ACRCVX_03605, partial [Shewanella sp.]